MIYAWFRARVNRDVIIAFPCGHEIRGKILQADIDFVTVRVRIWNKGKDASEDRTVLYSRMGRFRERLLK